MDGNDHTAHLPAGQPDEPTEQIFADVLKMADEVARTFISDDDVDKRLRKLKDAVAADTGDLPAWVLEIPVSDMDDTIDGVDMDQQLAVWVAAETTTHVERRRRSAKAELTAAREMVEAAEATAKAITDQALDEAAVTKAEAEIAAEQVRLATEREQLAAAYARLAADTAEARAQLEHDLQLARLNAERERLKNEAELARLRLEVQQLCVEAEQAKLEAEHARVVKNRTRLEANALLAELDRRVSTYPGHVRPEQPRFAPEGSPNGPGGRFDATAGIVVASAKGLAIHTSGEGDVIPPGQAIVPAQAAAPEGWFHPTGGNDGIGQVFLVALSPEGGKRVFAVRLDRDGPEAPLPERHWGTRWWAKVTSRCQRSTDNSSRRDSGAATGIPIPVSSMLACALASFAGADLGPLLFEPIDVEPTWQVVDGPIASPAGQFSTIKQIEQSDDLGLDMLTDTAVSVGRAQPGR
jgi:hypothetical protein